MDTAKVDGLIKAKGHRAAVLPFEHNRRPATAADADAAITQSEVGLLQMLIPACLSQFTRAVAGSLLESWQGIVERRRGRPYSEQQRHWQLLRRGRYVEFNLLYDRGVRFGLDSGRIESIMVSAPPLVAWDYDVTPAAGSPEAELLGVLREPRSWA